MINGKNAYELICTSYITSIQGWLPEREKS